MKVTMIFIVVCMLAGSGLGFRPMGRTAVRLAPVKMSDLVLAAMPTVEEWLDVADPKLKKATMGMFRAFTGHDAAIEPLLKRRGLI